MRKLPFILYGLIALLHLGGIATGQSAILLLLTKSLLLPLLAFAFLGSVSSLRSAFAKMILVAFFFSWMGDVLLLQSGQTTFFLAGLGAFLLAQLSYLRAFWSYSPRGMRTLQSYPWTVGSFILYLIAMLVILWPKLSSAFRLPVVVYSLALVSMGIFATGMMGKVSKGTGFLFLGGAILFILSDSIIALDRFSSWALWQPRFLIMSTYIAAQGLLCVGAIRAISAFEQP